MTMTGDVPFFAPVDRKTATKVFHGVSRVNYVVYFICSRPGNGADDFLGSESAKVLTETDRQFAE
jgi:hypothetical protein